MVLDVAEVTRTDMRQRGDCMTVTVTAGGAIESADSLHDTIMVLEAMRGPNGVCAMIDGFQRMIDKAYESPSMYCRFEPGMPKGKAHGDRTYSDVVRIMDTTSWAEEKMATAMELASAVEMILHRYPHGDDVCSYYLDKTGNVTWSTIASERGVSRRSVMNWRRACVKYAARWSDELDGLYRKLFETIRM